MRNEFILERMKKTEKILFEVSFITTLLCTNFFPIIKRLLKKRKNKILFDWSSRRHKAQISVCWIREAKFKVSDKRSPFVPQLGTHVVTNLNLMLRQFKATKQHRFDFRSFTAHFCYKNGRTLIVCVRKVFCEGRWWSV